MHHLNPYCQSSPSRWSSCSSYQWQNILFIFPIFVLACSVESVERNKCLLNYSGSYGQETDLHKELNLWNQSFNLTATLIQEIATEELLFWHIKNKTMAEKHYWTSKRGNKNMESSSVSISLILYSSIPWQNDGCNLFLTHAILAPGTAKQKSFYVLDRLASLCYQHCFPYGQRNVSIKNNYKCKRNSMT